MTAPHANAANKENCLASGCNGRAGEPGAGGVVDLAVERSRESMEATTRDTTYSTIYKIISSENVGSSFIFMRRTCSLIAVRSPNTV